MQHIPASSVIVELGCGDGSKTAVLLNALLCMRKEGESVHYCGIDVSAEALRQTEQSLQRLCPKLPVANIQLIEAEYLSGVEAAKKLYPDLELCVLWLGSSVGNFAEADAAAFLKKLVSVAGKDMQLWLCTDMWKDVETLRRAYDDEQGITRNFIINGMKHALRVLGHADSKAEGEDLFEYRVEVNTVDMQVCLFCA
jgi:uncharacterized SAM-dependent methyltransferase